MPTAACDPIPVWREPDCGNSAFVSPQCQIWYIVEPSWTLSPWLLRPARFIVAAIVWSVECIGIAVPFIVVVRIGQSRVGCGVVVGSVNAILGDAPSLGRTFWGCFIHHSLCIQAHFTSRKCFGGRVNGPALSAVPRPAFIFEIDAHVTVFALAHLHRIPDFDVLCSGEICDLSRNEPVPVLTITAYRNEVCVHYQIWMILPQMNILTVSQSSRLAAWYVDFEIIACENTHRSPTPPTRPRIDETNTSSSSRPSFPVDDTPERRLSSSSHKTMAPRPTPSHTPSSPVSSATLSKSPAA